MTSRILLLILSFSGTSCATQKAASGIDMKAIYNCWTDSREENPEGATSNIYRPCNYREFTPSRYRHRIEFKEGGKCTSLKLAPNDAHYMVEATWSYDKDQHLIIVKDEADKTILRFKVISLSKDRMEIEKQR